MNDAEVAATDDLQLEMLDHAERQTAALEAIRKVAVGIAWGLVIALCLAVVIGCWALLASKS